MDNYISQYQAAKLIKISRVRLAVLIKQGRFIKGKMLFNRHAGRKILQYKQSEVEEFAKNRAALISAKV